MHQEHVGQHSLARLSQNTDYQVAPRESDVRGWTVVSGDGTVIGRVDDFLIDSRRMTVAAFDVAIYKGDNVCVPAEDVYVDRQRRVVRVADYAPGRYRTAVAQQPPHSAERLPGTEEELRSGTRALGAADAVVGKHVETEHKHSPFDVRHEEFVIERRPVET